eukprot:9484720-Pyramimonas_sp.AAC.1
MRRPAKRGRLRTRVDYSLRSSAGAPFRPFAPCIGQGRGGQREGPAPPIPSEAVAHVAQL